MVTSHTSASEAGTYTEWRVSGIPDDGPYSFVWSQLLNDHLGDAETAARNFVKMVKEAPDKYPGLRQPWLDGPRLSQRTVTITEWSDEAA